MIFALHKVTIIDLIKYIIIINMREREIRLGVYKLYKH